MAKINEMYSKMLMKPSSKILQKISLLLSSITTFDKNIWFNHF
jgi:hypothetical protein